MKKILILDDDPEILALMEMILHPYGFEVLTIYNWKELFTSIEKFKPDLIMLDYYLSGNDGSTIYKKIKDKQHLENIPVLMFSARSETWMDVKYECDGFIGKPFEVKDLLKKINTLLKCNEK